MKNDTLLNGGIPPPLLYKLYCAVYPGANEPNGGKGAFMEDIMMNYTVEEAAKSFEEKFKANGFKRSVLPNNAPDYTSEKQVQEIEAVRDFLASDMLEYIANLT
ncbi:MAG: hypothetical protein LBF83_08300 [Spirochaetaceae bacterium]|nr:hypothetical protein [Spirochaetaceae bacterium]